MNCRRARKLLTGSTPPNPELRRHLERCPGCADFQRRHDAVLRALGEHHAAVTPPTGFAARVRSRLARDDDPIGWAALRLLPVSLLLVLVLSWLNLKSGDQESQSLADPTTAVLSWSLEPDASPPGDAP